MDFAVAKFVGDRFDFFKLGRQFGPNRFGNARIFYQFPDIAVGFQQVLFIGSLRGAVVLALGLSLPVELPYWWTIQSIAFGVVIFSLFVQAPLVDPLLRRSHLVGKENDGN